MGNSSSSKSSTKKPCTYCFKESCKGESCRFYFHTERDRSTSLGYSQGSLSTKYDIGHNVGISTASSAQHTPSYGWDVATHNMPPPRTTTLHQGSGLVATKASQPVSGVQQSGASREHLRATNAGPLSSNAATKIQSGSTVQPSSIVGTSKQAVIYTRAGPSPMGTSVSQQVKQTSQSYNSNYGENSAQLGVMGEKSARNEARASFNAKPEVKPNVVPNSSNLKSEHQGINYVMSSLSASSITKNSSNAEVICEASERKPRFKHSPQAVKYEGVILQIIGSRNAKVRVYEKNGYPVQKSEWEGDSVEHKYALLVVEKLINNESGNFYPSKTVIRDVISKGDIVELICTTHNNQSSGFHLYAHEAWLTGEKTQINDADAVASYISNSGSGPQENVSSKTKKDRITLGNNFNSNLSNENSCDSADVVNQWLETNKFCVNKIENAKPLKLIGGCHYIGKAIEIRSSYGFVVEISSLSGKQFVFVLPTVFYPLGINEPAMSPGTSLESSVNIGDDIVVIPVRNDAMEEGKFEWLASQAWPKNIPSAALINKKQNLLINPNEKENQFKDEKDNILEKQTVTYIKSHYPSAKKWKEFDGEIISLQYDWGLVKEKASSQIAYGFSRENAYLFGLRLEHFILDDVFKMGQPVKFSLDIDEPGTMYALAVWSGFKLPDYNSFDITTGKYCEENGVKFATEESLIQHGKALYLGC